MKDGTCGQEKIQKGNTLDVTYHDDVHFAEYNSKDESEAYLDPADYPNIVLGTMETTDDAQGMIEGLLGEMGFGEGIGNWSPALPGGSAEYPGTGEPENPGTGDPENPGTGDPTNPGQNTGAGTGNENNSGNTGNNGTVNNNGSAQNAAANANVVQTGDTTNVVPYVAALLASVVILLGAVLAIRMRRK